MQYHALPLTVLFTLVLAWPATAGGGELPEHLLDPQQVEAISAEQFHQLIEARRGEVILVNLWATWCIPCIQELPDLALMQERYAERGLRVIAVSLDDPEDLEEKVRGFLDKRAPELVSYLNAEADEYAFAETIDPQWLGALPTTWLFDRSGELRKSHAGRLLYKEMEEMALELLDESAAQ